MRKKRLIGRIFLNMHLSDFDYNLPKKFIAQNPVTPRDHSKLMVFDTANDNVLHKYFYNICNFLHKGDIVVLNRSRVIPARILFEHNGRECEVFLLKELEDAIWQVMVRPGKYFSSGKCFKLSDDCYFNVKRVLEDGTRILGFDCENNFSDYINKLGTTPLPPYITHFSADSEQYQTVYSKEEGSVAAPTAGLHFTKDLIKTLKSKGVVFVEVILHVGRGTFEPVKVKEISDHVMHEESFELPTAAAEVLNAAKKDGQRIIACGTTSVRVLETCYDEQAGFIPQISSTDIFIYPGKYKWKVVDALITNFHLPKSTLIMLVASFLENKGVDEPVKKILELYALGQKMDYRFFSFGDACFLF